MFTVYILRDSVGKIYKGLTNDLRRRISEHKRGKTKTTRNMKNMRLVYKEEFLTFKEARKRELYFKMGAGRRFLKKILGA